MSTMTGTLGICCSRAFCTTEETLELVPRELGRQSVAGGAIGGGVFRTASVEFKFGPETQRFRCYLCA